MNLLLEKKYGLPSQNFVKENVLCEKGDKITRFDGRGIAKGERRLFLFHAWNNALFYLPHT
jgi:hypothetical protein